MDFSPSLRAQEWQARLSAFMSRYLLPYNAAWHASVQRGEFPPPFMQDLKALGRVSWHRMQALSSSLCAQGHSQ